jgi:hypothetical protein
LYHIKRRVNAYEKNLEFFFSPVVQAKWAGLFNTATDATDRYELPGAISFAIPARNETSSEFAG